MVEAAMPMASQSVVFLSLQQQIMHLPDTQAYDKLYAWNDTVMASVTVQQGGICGALGVNPQQWEESGAL
jgi:hypothetical protein